MGANWLKNTMEPITVTFPLTGIWQVVTSPGDHVPSHYTDALGMTYAFDFAKCKDVNISLFARLLGVKADSCEAWNSEVISPIKGRVIEVQNKTPDRKKLCLFTDAFSGIYPLLFSRKAKYFNKIFGNYVIIENENCCCLVAHLKESSITIEPGKSIKAGDFIGRIGHSGSSQRLHLHVQLMDSSELLESKGIAMNFNLKVKDKRDKWNEIPMFVPRRHQIVQATNKALQQTSR